MKKTVLGMLLLGATSMLAGDRFTALRAIENANIALESQGIPADRVAAMAVSTDQVGTTHVRYREVIDGVPVFGRFVVAHESRRGFSFDGDVLPAGFPLRTDAAISADEAIRAAIANFGGEGVASAELVVLPKNGSLYLAYDVDVKNTLTNETNEPRRQRMFIDAQNGSVLMEYNNLQTAKPGSGGGSSSGTAAVGVGYGYYAGVVTTLPISVSGTTYMLQDVPNNGKTYDFANATCNIFGCGTNTGTLFTSTSSTFGTTGSLSERSAIGVDAHFFAQKTLAYFNSTFGRNGIDNAGNKNLQMGHMVSRTHYGKSYNNAYWDGASMTYGDGDGTTYNPFDALDVVGHEMTHGITERTSDLVYQNESGAANESYSDIFGVTIEFKSGTIVGYGNKSYSPDWLMGEDLYKNQDGTKAIRNMADTHQQGDPDHYSERYTGTSDNGGVHTNSGIQNKVFYLLSQGGTHHLGGTVTAIGLDRASAIAYNALTVYTTNSSSTYAQTAKAWVTAATNLYGSTVAAEVQNAWKVCGVTPAP
ncbi:MAG: M4 family metallopeptidase [Acidobacteriota bacterium]|nr:M4 family metallopeptidase [Acidobacteriota bacterium]